MEKKTFNCCFTGYRPQKFDFPFTPDNEEYIALENKLTDAIFSLPQENCFKFYCGMAMGFDILAGEIVNLLKKTIKSCRIELVAVIPFRAQADGWDDEWKTRYDNLMQCADYHIYISENYWKGCYLKRNKYMVDNSDMVITWYDGKSGGTASTLNYAFKNNKRIVNLAENGVFDYEIQSPYIIEDE